jgi:phosphatidylserine/phosphatidylglycerophosphate/cardiolipin synthase-like enzyme
MRRKRKNFYFNRNAIPLIFIVILSFSVMFRNCKAPIQYKEIQGSEPIKVLFTRKDNNVLENLKFYISKAKNSIYLASFEFGNQEIANELVNAKKRGLSVQVVSDKKNEHYEALKFIKNNGIEVVLQNLQSYMHHKFIVIDSEIVITGSANFTDNDLFLNDNNIVIIRSKLLALNYLKEFKQMFEFKKFSTEKERIGNNILDLGGIRIENYFSPQDKPSRRIIELIEQSKKTIHFLAYSFTHHKIANAMIRANRRGVKIYGIFEKRQAAKFSEYQTFTKLNFDVHLDNNPRNMHNKVIIIDSSIVITGSYNFSSNADNENDENLIIIFSRKIALTYLDYYQWLLK